MVKKPKCPICNNDTLEHRGVKRNLKGERGTVDYYICKNGECKSNGKMLRTDCFFDYKLFCKN